ncbi:MAG: diguanylate cyclase [Acidobacteria bacterium]|nr:MAG: diguanylate cyclase [Acidobacteriota bacterium]
MKVLVADDEPVNRRLLEILLSKWGYEVTVATDGEEAWRHLQSPSHPRIAILDWMMPGMDGIEVCRRIREDKSRGPVYLLLLTAKQATEDANGRYESVADDYLPKPYSAHELKARLRAARRILELETQLLEANDAIQSETTRDTLTGLWNHSSILEILHREIHRARRHGTSLTVLMADINDLKQINHQHGHLVGDAIMREVARRMRSSIRAYDSLGRYSGGQFVIVSPDCDRSGAVSQAQRIQSAVSQETFRTFKGDFSVTVSMGITVGCSSHQAHELISAADAALTEAKKAGPNQIELAFK